MNLTCFFSYHLISKAVCLESKDLLALWPTCGSLVFITGFGGRYRQDAVGQSRGRGSRASAFPPQSSLKSLQESVLPASGTCSSRPRSQRPASFSSMRCSDGAGERIERIVSPCFS